MLRSNPSSLLSACCPLLLALPAAAQVGPDNFGYYAFSSNDLGGPSYQWIEIGASGTLVASGDDESSTSYAPYGTAVPLGAPFSLYGSTYTALVPTTNGYISTDPADAGPDLSNDCPLPRLPSSGTGARVYPLHDDLVGEVRYQYFASSPALHWSGQDYGVSVFQWNVEHYPAGNTTLFAFQALLFDNGDILYQYAAGNPEQGSGSTTGVQDLPAQVGLSYACNEPSSIPEGFAVLITRTPPPVNGDAQLAVRKASFAIDWAAHELSSPEDTLSVQALFNPAGLVPDLTGATLRVELRGEELLAAAALDAKGQLRSPTGLLPSVSARLDARGALQLKFAGLDLRAATGLQNQSGTGLVDLPLLVTLTGGGLLEPELRSTITFAYSTQENLRSSGSAALSKAGNLTPIFLPLQVKVTEVPGEGHVVQVSKALLQFSASAPALPIDRVGVAADVRVEVGTADAIEVPFQSLRIRGDGSSSAVDYVATLLDVVGLARLSVKNSARSLAFTTGILPGTGIPLAQLETTALEHDLRLGLLFHTEIGPVRAYATVRIRRSSTTSGSWSS
ncbi:MAG: hypothetical protein IPN34_03085 [Planctomycetes bacterium]|nr:hypothetical protein [Planctomycetota bacterium]